MRRTIRKASVITAIFLLVIGGFFLYQAARIAGEIKKQTGLTPITTANLLFDTGVPVKQTADRVNILLLGMGGGTHEGADLTDTMLLVSFDTKKNTLAMISVPRDLWSDTLKAKVNTAYHYGEEKKKGGGLTLAKAIIEDVTGMPVHYAVIVDFSQFVGFVDAIGGIDITVPKTFTDTEYPIEGKENDPCGGDPEFKCRYETVTFTAGAQHMDGTQALKYVRTRHAEGEEGTDFARGKRQQDVMVAVKEKIMSLKPWLHPNLALSLYKSGDRATDSDMNIGEALTIGKMILKSGADKNIKKISLESQLKNPPLTDYGTWVLVPEKDFSALHEYILLELNKE